MFFLTGCSFDKNEKIAYYNDETNYIIDEGKIVKIIFLSKKLKKDVLHKDNLRLNAQDILTALSIAATTNPIVEEAIDTLYMLEGAEAHSTVVLNHGDKSILKSLKINVTQEAIIKK